MPARNDNPARQGSAGALERRLETIERNVTHLNATVDQLHRMLQEQRGQISEYVTRQLVAAGQEGGVSAEDALFTFVCRRKFDEIERELARLRRVLASRPARRAG